jgi:hypothetical protein
MPRAPPVMRIFRARFSAMFKHCELGRLPAGKLHWDGAEENHWVNVADVINILVESVKTRIFDLDIVSQSLRMKTIQSKILNH